MSITIEELEKYFLIQNTIKKEKEKIELAKNDYYRLVENSKKIIQSCQEKCNHPDRKYYSDPSGNNDNYYECKLCGKEL